MKIKQEKFYTDFRNSSSKGFQEVSESFKIMEKILTTYVVSSTDENGKIYSKEILRPEI